MPSSLTGKLTAAAVEQHIATVEEAIARLRSIAELPNWRERAQGRSVGTTTTCLLMGLDDDGGRTYLSSSSDRARPYTQVRWCHITRRYVVHRMNAHSVTDPLEGNAKRGRTQKAGKKTKPAKDAKMRLVPIDDTRECESSAKCRKRARCEWPSIRDAPKARPDYG